jgi:hypothetical protein
VGREKVCFVRVGRTRSEGKALLETSELVFRGEPRLRIPFQDIRSLEVHDGELVIKHRGGTATFEIGRDAERWAELIRSPKPRIDKLGIKPGTRVALVGIEDSAFINEVAERTGDAAPTRPRSDTDLVFLGVSTKAQLDRLEALRAGLKPDGGIWVVWPKGRAELHEDDVRVAGKRAGLVDIKVVAFSPTHAALKLVIPVDRRR